MSEDRPVREDRGIRDDLSARRGSEPRGFVLEKFGQGKVKREQMEELRRSLMRDLEAKGLAEGPGTAVAVYEEVEKFLENGHISGSNLNRLERRVLRRVVPGGSSSARGSRPATSEFTGPAGSRSAGSRTPGPFEAAHRLVREGARTPMSARSCTPSSMAGDDAKWSEVATYRKLMEEKDRVEARGKIRARQDAMRLDLERQMLEKEQKKVGFVEEEKQIFERQKVELKLWHEAESKVVEEQKRVASDVRKEREVQIAVVHAIREDEKQKKRLDEDLQVRRAEEKLEQERKVALAKKHLQRDAMQKLMADWAEDQKNRDAVLKLKAADEQLKASEYVKMLDVQEARNKKGIPVVRNPMGEYAPPNKAERRKKEQQEEAKMMILIRAANATAAEAELQKTEQKSKDRHSNQEFLAQQITERNAAKKVRNDELQRAKESVLAKTIEFKDEEKHRAEEQKRKNLKYRIELEKQIEGKKKIASPAYNSDLMSAAEVAMNRHLLQEARSMTGASGSQTSQVHEMQSTF